MKRPWMQFCTRDWLNNKELQRCSDESQAILIRLMCLAHEGTPYGYLADRIGPLTDDFMSAKCLKKLPQFRRAIIELVKYERLHRDEKGYFVKRMVDDEALKVKRTVGGKLGGNPNLKVGIEVNLPVNILENMGGEPPSESVSVSCIKSLKPEEKRNTSTESVLLDFAWKRHAKFSNREPQQLVFQMVFDKVIDYTVHNVYCDYWDKHGWQFSQLTFLGWINAGQPLPPPEVISAQAAREKARYEELMRD